MRRFHGEGGFEAEGSCESKSIKVERQAYRRESPRLAVRTGPDVSRYKDVKRRCKRMSPGYMRC